MEMSEIDELRLLQLCRTTRFLSEIVPLSGLPERQCRGILQSMKTRRLVRLVRRRWATTRAGEAHLQALLAEMEEKEREAQETGKRIESLRAPLRERLLAAEREMHAVARECEEIPLAGGRLRQLRPNLGAVQSLRERLEAGRDEQSVLELERLVDDSLPGAVDLVREVHAQVADLGLFETVRDVVVIDDPIWLLCGACGKLQGQTPSFDQRYECLECHRKGRSFLPAKKSVEDYIAPSNDRKYEVSAQEQLRRRLRKVLQVYHLPGPVARKILAFLDRSPVSLHDVHFACRVWMGEKGTRLIVAATFLIPPNYPLPWPNTPW